MSDCLTTSAPVRNVRSRVRRSSRTSSRWASSAPAACGLALALVPAVALAQGVRQPESPPLTFPGAQWETATPESQGLDGGALAAAIARLPSPANQGPLIVVANGRAVYSVGNVSEPRDLFSCSKAVTAMVVARLIEQGQLRDLDELLPSSTLGAWNAYPGDASYRMFLSMTSDYGLPAPRSPGNRHAYNNHGIDFVGEYVSRTFYRIGPDQMHTVVRRAMLDQIGRQDGASFNGQWGGWYGGLRLSVRDLARLGLLLMRDGVWDGQRLLAEGFASSMFRNQIPSTSTRYQSSNPRENSMWNQQAVTDRLDDRFSFGLWRVGDPRASGAWGPATMDGYRGKRALLCPRGSLPNPSLELMLVCLPNLTNEGPATEVYLDALVQAVRVPDRHPDHDARCVTNTFDDGTTGRLEQRFGSAVARQGSLEIIAPSQFVLPGEHLDDATVVFSIRSGLPAGARVGAILRARQESDDAFSVSGTQTHVALEHGAGGNLRVLVLHPRNGALVWHRGPILSQPPSTDPLVVRIDVDGDRVRAKVNGEIALGAVGYAGIPTPGGGGSFGLRSTAHTQPIRVDYLLVRPAGGPIGQVGVDARGEHTIAFLAPDHLGNIPAGVFQVEYDDLVMDPSVLPLVIPWVWPTAVAVQPDHVILSSEGAPVPLEAGHSLVIQVGNQREGEILR